MSGICISSYAKVNLSLDITGKNDNGYHLIRTVFQQIDLHDDVAVSWQKQKDLSIDIKSGRKDLPAGSGNLAWKAACVLLGAIGESGKVVIEITKRIPVAAGSAGGSSNAAAVMLALNKLTGSRLSLERLMELGAGIGADVPFCIMGQAWDNKAVGFPDEKMAAPCALGEDIGTKLTPLPPVKGYIVLSKPNVAVLTKDVYNGMDDIKKIVHPDIDRQIEGLRNGDFSEVVKNMNNVLELFSLCVYDSVLYTKNNIQEYSYTNGVLMSGSGPTVFLLTEDKSEAENVYDRMKAINRETFLTKTSY